MFWMASNAARVIGEVVRVLVVEVQDVENILSSLIAPRRQMVRMLRERRIA